MSTCYRRAADVITRDISGETVLVPVRTGMADLCHIHLLNEVGARVWGMLDGQTPLETIVGSIVETFEVPSDTAREDAAGLIADLCSAGLAEAVPGEGEP